MVCVEASNTTQTLWHWITHVAVMHELLVFMASLDSGQHALEQQKYIQDWYCNVSS